MTNGGRIFAGVFSIIGSGIILIMALIFWFIGIIVAIFGESALLLIFLVLLACGILGLVGGILLLVDKMAGGVLALVGGAVDFVLTIVLVFLGSGLLLPLIIMFFIPPAILLTGGIVGLAVGSEFS